VSNEPEPLEDAEVLPTHPDRPQLPSTPDDRTMALLCHLGGLLPGGFIIALIIWLIKKDQSKYVDDQGKEALNFQITLFLGHLIGIVTICFTAGSILFLVWIYGVVFAIIAAVAVNKGEVYRYPLNIRLL
jgi:uncharacterized Tic20 family protein